MATGDKVANLGSIMTKWRQTSGGAPRGLCPSTSAVVDPLDNFGPLFLVFHRDTSDETTFKLLDTSQCLKLLAY